MRPERLRTRLGAMVTWDKALRHHHIAQHAVQDQSVPVHRHAFLGEHFRVAKLVPGGGRLCTISTSHVDGEQRGHTHPPDAWDQLLKEARLEMARLHSAASVG